MDRVGLHLIPLYEEQPVVVMSRENELSLYDDVPSEELDAETRLDIVACGGAQEAVEVAASGAGVVVLPMSLARLYARKDAVHRPVPGLPVTTIGIAWRAEHLAMDARKNATGLGKDARKQLKKADKAVRKTAADVVGS